MRPTNVGILAIEVYFPKIYVSQEELEVFDGVSKGKYTIGLGQKNMSFVEPYEDVNSMALTVVQNTLEKYKIDPRSIGRLEVGTETLLDKSKSTKTVLMQLFNSFGNNDIEGVSSINACYGGTAALFNTVAWVESSAYDGKKLGCVVTVDVAVYKKGSARPTGGAGAVCMIIGPDSQIVIEPIRSSFLDHAYDFYKPDPRSEFPTVDGHLSIKTYLSAIDNNYQTMNSKYQALTNSHFTLKNIDYGCFHAPFQKMVQKAYTRLLFNDVVNGNNKDFLSSIAPETIQFLKTANYSSKEVQSLIGKITFPSFLEKVKPSLFMGENLGNIYTGSLYSGLCSLLCNDSINLKNKRVLMFSYGSGLASSLFTLKFGHDYSKISRLLNLSARMAARIKISPTEYDQIMALREKAFGYVPPSPIVNFDRLEPGTYYLSSVDSMWRREYQRYTRDSIKARSAWICKNDCSSQNNQENKAFVLDDALFLEQKTKLTERLEQFKRQMSSVQSSSSNSQPISTENSKQQQQSVVTKKRSHSSDKNLNSKIWAGFYKKTLLERLDQIQKVESGIDTQKFLDGGLTLERAELMIENCIGKISLPLGLGLNFKINNKYYTIPMATEEPSVIAAASSAAKFIDENGGGFQTFSTRPIMIGQIQLLDVEPMSVIYKIDQNKDKLLAYANEICQNMVARGGGAKDIKVRILDVKEKKVRSTGEFEVDQMAVVDFLIHVCDSMGANIVNTIMEYVAPMVEEITGGRAGLKILSNLCTERRAVAEFEIPVSKMGWKDASGEQVVKRMIEGYRFAQLDPYRASTHNKGILNGMDAVAIATGQDWRSIESSCHTYASVKDRKAGYQPLTHYQLIRSKKQSTLGVLVFHGSIEVPIAVGSQGGVLHSNQLYQNNLKLLGFPNAQQLSEIIAAVGLGQNFSALKALAIEGIQKGHMNLHARNIAISGGVPTHLVEEATRFMRSRSKMNVDTAKAYLQAHNLFELVRLEEKDTAATVKQPLSTFYVELECETLDEPIILHVALDCLVGPDHQPIHLTIEPQQQSSVAQKQPSFVQDIQTLLFGPKGYEWLLQIFQALELVNLNFSEKNISNALTSSSSSTLGGTATPPPRKLLYKLKLIAIIIDLLANNMLALDCERSTKVIEQLMSTFSQQRKSMLAKLNIAGLIGNSNKSEPLSMKDMALQFGLTLLSECIRVFEYNIDSTRVADQLLKETLLSELALILESQVQARLLWRRAIKGQPLPLEDQSTFLQYRQKRLCATMMLFCDCVNLNSSFITPAALEVIRRLGSLYEIEITIARDFHKWQPNLKEVNLYSFWLLQRNELQNGELPANKTAFMAEYMNVLAQKRKKLEPMLDEKLRALCDISSEVIRSFYNFQDKIAPKSRL